MTLSITAELDATHLVWPAVPVATITLRNEGTQPVRWLNDGRQRSHCGLTLQPADGGEALAWDAPSAGVIDPPEQRIAPGETLRQRIRLDTRGALPGPGRWWVRAHATHADGEAQSEAAEFHVVAARPTAIDLASSSGGPNGHALCAAVDSSGPRATLSLTTLSTTHTPRVCHSEVLGEVTPHVWPVLSVPARVPARRPHVAWIDGQGLAWAAIDSPGVTTGSMALEPGWQLVAPLCEGPAHDGTAPSADAVLVRVSPDAWWVRIARLGARTLGTPVGVRGAPPVWGKTLVHADHRRDLFSAHPGPDAASVVLLRTRLSDTADPAPPQLAATVTGAFVAADVRAGHGAGAAGVVLGRLSGHGAHPRLVAHRFRLASADADVRVEPLVEIELPPGSVVTRAWVAADATGTIHALLDLAPAGATPHWVAWAEGRGLLPLPPDVAAAPGPRMPLLLHGTRPAIVWTDPHAGLRVHPIDPPLPLMPPG